MSKRRKGKRAVATAPVATAPVAPITAFRGDEVGRFDVGGDILWYNIFEHAKTQQDPTTVWMAARSVYENTSRVRKLVEDIVNYSGWYMPIPNTSDRSFNKAARAWFYRHCVAAPIDVTGQLNFITLQLWAEKWRCIYGDVLLHAVRTDNGPMLATYKAPQVSNDGLHAGANIGVVLSPSGRPLGYTVHNYADGTSATLSAAQCRLYRHDPDPTKARGESDFKTGILDARDTAEVQGQLKAGIKLAASLGLVETMEQNDRTPGMASALFEQAKCEVPPPARNLVMGGTRIVTLGPGRKIQTVADNRPGPNAAAFLDKLDEQVANSPGLEGETTFTPSKMGSAVARFLLEKLRSYSAKREQWSADYRNWIYRLMIAWAIRRGELQAPAKSDEWANVQWVGQRDMTIDIGRVSNAAIQLCERGMMSYNSWCEGAEGRPAEDVLRELAENKRLRHELEREYGLEPGELCPHLPGQAPQQVANISTASEDPEPETQTTYNDEV